MKLPDPAEVLIWTGVMLSVMIAVFIISATARGVIEVWS